MKKLKAKFGFDCTRGKKINGADGETRTLTP